MAHQMAMLNPHFKADVVEANEFMEFSQQYYVFGVPKTVVNNLLQFEGSVPESAFMDYIVQATS
jgi:hypothetical protein